MYRVVRFKPQKIRRGGVVDSKERVRSSPARAGGSWWAHSAISRSQLVKTHTTRSRPNQLPDHPPAFRMLPNTLLTDLANGDFGSASYVAHMHNELAGLLRRTLSA